MKDLLSYLAKRSIEDASVPIPEQEIGISVFGRKDYSASQDNLVRVHCTQLRKKLERYWAAEGSEDRIVFEIPRGSYALQFHVRPASPHVPAPAPTPRKWYFYAAVGLAGAALIAAGWLARGVAQRTSAAQPTVARFWSGFFGNGATTHIVLGDANLTVFQDFIRRSVTLRDYQRPAVMQQWLKERGDDAEARYVIERMSVKYFVTLADAQAARRIETLGLPTGTRVRVDFPKTFNIEYLMHDNAVLVGNRRMNPWVELFERPLRFQYRFDEKKVMATFEDTMAGAGEPRFHPTIWSRESHCQIAVLPNLRQNGNVLIISEGDMTAAEAAADFLTNERWVQELAKRLGASGRQRFPYFEALLRTEMVSNAAPSFHLVACRTLKP